MRLILRSLLTAYLAVFISQEIVGGLSFGGDTRQTLILFMLGVALLNIFMIPIFKVLRLPLKGLSFLFLNFILTLIVIYALTLFVPDLMIVETELAKLRIFGYVLPSKHLTITWSAVFSALIISIVYHFFEWLCDRR